MALDTSGLTALIQENPNGIATEAILGLKSLDFLSVIQGITATVPVEKLVSEASLQSGACGWSPTGTTVLTERNLTVFDYKSQEALCDKDLKTKFGRLQGRNKVGTNSDEFSLEQAYVDNKVLTIGNALDNLIWNATTVASANDFDGFVKIATDDCPAANQFTRTGSVSADVDMLLTKLPVGALVGGGLVTAMSVANFLALVVEYRTADSNFIPLFNQTDLEFVYPGTNMKVVGMPGMGAINDIMIYNMENLIVGTELESELSESSFHWSVDNREHRFHFGARIGVQIAIPAEVAIATTA